MSVKVKQIQRDRQAGCGVLPHRPYVPPRLLSPLSLLTLSRSRAPALSLSRGARLLPFSSSFLFLLTLPLLHVECTQLAQSKGALVFAQVGSIKEATEALACGVDGVIAQGREAGGHGLRSELGSGTLPLAARIVEIARGNEATKEVVVLAAGGIVDGRSGGR